MARRALDGKLTPWPALFGIAKIINRRKLKGRPFKPEMGDRLPVEEVYPILNGSQSL